jgi:pentatricopeptide repeat protein
MVSKGLQPDAFTYNTFVAMYANRGMLAEALNVIRHMKKSGCKPGEVTYRTLVDAYCKLGRFDEVERILKFIKNSDPNFDKTAFRRVAARVNDYDPRL